VSILIATSTPECASVRPLVEAHVRYERSATELPPDWDSRTADLIGAERLVLFVAIAAGAPVGYATLTHDVETWSAKPYAHLDCLYVADGHRDTGIGKLLIDAVVQRVRGWGYSELQWQTPAWNAGAVRFYDRLGAQHQAKERFSFMV
jgi:GNAT superfamily N-acetyltransferase